MVSVHGSVNILGLGFVQQTYGPRSRMKAKKKGKKILKPKDFNP